MPRVHKYDGGAQQVYDAGSAGLYLPALDAWNLHRMTLFVGSPASVHKAEVRIVMCHTGWPIYRTLPAFTS